MANLWDRLTGPTNQEKAAYEINRLNIRQGREQERTQYAMNLANQMAQNGIWNPEEGPSSFKIDEFLRQDPATGMYVHQGLILQGMNMSNKFTTFLDTKEGVEKNAFAVTLDPNTPDGQGPVIIMQRDDNGKFAPKTNTASDAPEGIPTMTQDEFEGLMMLNFGMISNLAYPDLAQGQLVSRATRRDDNTWDEKGNVRGSLNDVYAQAGETANEIDAADIPVGEGTSMITELAGELKARHDALVAEEQKEIEGMDVDPSFGSIPKNSVERKSLPSRTIDTSDPKAKSAYELAKKILATDETVVYGEDDRMALLQGYWEIVERPTAGNKHYTNVGMGTQNKFQTTGNMSYAVRRLQEASNLDPDEMIKVSSNERLKMNQYIKRKTGRKSSRNKFKGSEIAEMWQWRVDTYNKKWKDMAQEVVDNLEKDDAALKEAGGNQRNTVVTRIKNLESELETMQLSPSVKTEKENQLQAARKQLNAIDGNVGPGLMDSTIPNIITKGEDGKDLLEKDENDLISPENAEKFIKQNESVIQLLSENDDLKNKFKAYVDKYGVQSLEDLKNTREEGRRDGEIDLTDVDIALISAAYDQSDQPFHTKFSGYLNAFSGERGTQQARAINAENLKMALDTFNRNRSDWEAQLGQKFVDLNEELIELMWDEEGDLTDWNERAQLKTTNLLNEIKNLRGGVHFNYNTKTKKYEISGPNVAAAKDALEHTAGILFLQAVRRQGPADFPDRIQGWFSPGDPIDIGQIMRKVRYRREVPGDSNSPIEEIYLTPAGRPLTEAQGSLKPGGLSFRFGGPKENSYGRNLLMYFIQELGTDVGKQ